MRVSATIGLVLALLGLGIAVPPGFSAEREPGRGPRPEISMTGSLVEYRTAGALLPDFLRTLAQSTGLEVQGAELLDETPLAPEAKTESLPALIAWLLEGYNYVLVYGEGETSSAGAPAGTLVIVGRKLPPGAAGSGDSVAAVSAPKPGEGGEGQGYGAVPAPGSRSPAALTQEGASPAAKAEPATVQPTVGAMLGDQLSSFRTSQKSGSGIGQMMAPSGSGESQASAAGSLGTTSDNVNAAALQEATQRALLQVKELVRGLETASSQLSLPKK